MNFASDNWTGVADPIGEAIAAASGGAVPAYGADALTAEAKRAFSDLFERDVAVFFVATGTAANALSLSTLARPGGIAFCHRQAHINNDEGGATEFLADLKLIGLDGAAGKLRPEALAAAVSRYAPDPGRHGRPVAVSLSNLTEAGTAYSVGEVSAIAAIAKDAGLAVHMDGARFANAVAGLGISPADLTWKAGVDILSFGGTKNGCWLAEAIVILDPAMAEGVNYIRKRAGHQPSKQRFFAAQFAAYLKDGLWLTLASHANGMAKILAAGIVAAGGRLAWPADGNEVFAIVTKPAAARARTAGAMFYEWEPDHVEADPGKDECLLRFVTSFATREEEVARLLAVLSP
jgi:threonine aldolase